MILECVFFSGILMLLTGIISRGCGGKPTVSDFEDVECVTVDVKRKTH